MNWDFVSGNFDIKVSTFFSSYGFMSTLSRSDELARAITFDMELGLQNNSKKDYDRELLLASQEMIPTWKLPPQKLPQNTSIIVIDAGGTNFRAGLVHFDSKGKFSLVEEYRHAMPGTEGVCTKSEFFNKIADYLEPLKNKATRLGFCFSYAMETLPNGDGKLLYFAKEIQAPEVEGCCIGKELTEVLQNRGWNSFEKVVLLNDTVAALLSGAVLPKHYNSYIGFILGTGMNAAYIEHAEYEKLQKTTQIVVCESGHFNKIYQSYFDLIVDGNSENPGSYVLEKMCAGAYLGKLFSAMVSCGIKDGLFSSDFSKNCLPENISWKMVNDFVLKMYKKTLKSDLYSELKKYASQDDIRICLQFAAAIVRRTVFLAQNILLAVAYKTSTNSYLNEVSAKKAKRKKTKICIVCEGTTLLKTFSLFSTLKKAIRANMKKDGNIHVDFILLPHTVSLGSALATL